MTAATAFSTRAQDDIRDARRRAAMARLKAAGDGLSPALIAEGQASLANAFALSNLLFRKPADETA